MHSSSTFTSSTLPLFYRVLFVLVTGCIWFSSFVSISEAHELLPKEIVTYIQENPDATPEELRAFAESVDPATGERFRNSSTEEILSILANPGSTFLDNAWDFVKLGFHHILAGADHILFILTLLLIFVTAKDLLMFTSTFTVAHSITLILAGAGIVVLSPTIVEPLIALSISVMALVTLFENRLTRFRTRGGPLALIFFFGLFHGLGFAGLLEAIAIPQDKFLSSLLAFNVGVEFGQLAIILVALPVLLLIRKKAWYPLISKIMALFIALAGFLWFIERSGLIG